MKVIESRCPQNHKCPAISICPTKAIVQTGYSAPVIIEEKCLKCGKCAMFCPMGALSN